MAQRAIATPVLIVLFFVCAVSAEAGVVSRRVADDPAFWTADRLLRARPMRLLEVRTVDLESTRREAGSSGVEAQRSGVEDVEGASAVGADEGRRARRSGSGRSSPPRAGVAPRFGSQLFDPKLLSSPRYRVREGRPSTSRAVASAAGGAVEGTGGALGAPIVPANRGTFLLDFSSSRLVPEDARVVWPFSAVGKLFFSSGSSGFVCSAAVISSRVVMTAGHCVYDAVAGEFYTNFTFVPAYHRGEAPYGTWRPSFVATTDTWSNGGEEIPNDADFGVLVMNDQDGMKIGNVTGWLGYKLNDLTPNQVKLLGYPANFDGGQRMHQIDSGAYECCFGRSAIYGSDMKGGPSV